MTQTELIEMVGKRPFITEYWNLITATLNYKSGIPTFDAYLKTLNSKEAVFHLSRNKKGFAIEMDITGSTVYFGIIYTEIKKIVLTEQSETSLIDFETVENKKITFYFTTEKIYDVINFFNTNNENYT